MCTVHTCVVVRTFCSGSLFTYSFIYVTFNSVSLYFSVSRVTNLRRPYDDHQRSLNVFVDGLPVLSPIRETVLYKLLSLLLIPSFCVKHFTQFHTFLTYAKQTKPIEDPKTENNLQTPTIHRLTSSSLYILKRS